MNKNVVLGVATGVAALVVIGIIAKKTGALDTLMQKLTDLASTVEDKFADIEKFGMHDVIPKGEDKNVSSTLTSNTSV